MIVTKLKKLIETRNLNINKVSSESGVSRPALTALVNNESKGIQFDTLEKLMTYFNVPISDILGEQVDQSMFLYVPGFNISKIKELNFSEPVKRTDGMVEYRPKDLMIFNAIISENEIAGTPFSFLVSPVINQDKVLVLIISLYRKDDSDNLSDLHSFLGKLDTEGAINMAESIISTWLKLYSQIAENKNFLNDLLLIEISVVGGETKIPLLANTYSKNRGNGYRLDFDIFRKNSPVKGNQKYSENLVFSFEN